MQYTLKIDGYQPDGQQPVNPIRVHVYGPDARGEDLGHLDTTDWTLARLLGSSLYEMRSRIKEGEEFVIMIQPGYRRGGAA